MSYKALYRRLRPKCFSGVVAQDHITITLKNQIMSDRITHAYIFSGTRGTGKTSTAKIFSRAINCYNPSNGEPCCECEFCLLSDNEAALVINEIDAASQTGVDNMRDLIDAVKYPPTIGRYKVYIIDEVHMLSTSSFNALLKTLEEPPSHVVFILATTEPHKILPTIHSRCQRFDFKRISVTDMAETIMGYANADGIDVDMEALLYISRLADGAMRDALSVLDQCLSFYYGEKITVEKVMNIVGSAGIGKLINMTDALVKMDLGSCINMIDDLIVNGIDLSYFTQELIGHIRNLLVCGSQNSSVSMNGELSNEDYQSIATQSKSASKNTFIDYINILSDTANKMKYAQNPRVVFEVACIKICSPEAETTSGENQLITKMQREIEILKSKLDKQPIHQSTKTIETKPAEKTKPKKEKAIPDDIKNMISSWGKFIDFLKDKREWVPVAGKLKNTHVHYVNDQILSIVADSEVVRDMLRPDEEILKNALADFFKKDVMINFIYIEDFKRLHQEIYGYQDEEGESFMENVKKIFDFD